MKPPATAEADLRLWGVVTATVRPLGSRSRARQTGAVVSQAAPSRPGLADASTPVPPLRPQAASARERAPAPAPEPSGKVKLAPPPPKAPAALEPGRRRRLERGRDAPAGVIDLHGLNQDEARNALTRFVMQGFAERRRTLLVITGKGALGDGVLRRRVPEWLGQPPVRPMIAGLSEAHRRHGGEGALYVALRRC